MTSYYFDSKKGSNTNSGLSPEEAFKGPWKLRSLTIKPGDLLLFKRGTIYYGCIELSNIYSEAGHSLTISCYGDDLSDALPILNAKKHLAGITIKDCSFVTVKSIEIINDSGGASDKEARQNRYGVYILSTTDESCNSIQLEELYIHDVYADEMRTSEGRNKETSFGIGVYCKNFSQMKNISFVSLKIENTGYFGVRTNSSSSSRIENFTMLNCSTYNTGGSGLLMGQVYNGLVKNCTIDKSGSFVDTRMHGRGSGSWTFNCDTVLYDCNTFQNAEGPGDSAGMHIDFNCRNIVVQRCFSFNNAGGFIEILGNCYNCCYRYNISVNDGYRTKHQDGAFQNGKLFWISNFSGKNNERRGPFFNYIYNNTMFVQQDIISKFSVADTTLGLCIMNNIFHILGQSKDVSDDQNWNSNVHHASDARVENIIFENNVYSRQDALPPKLKIQDKLKIIGDPIFQNPNGDQPTDYIPYNEELIQGKGIEIQNLPGDDIGLFTGFQMDKDIFDNPIVGHLSLGAVQI